MSTPQRDPNAGRRAADGRTDDPATRAALLARVGDRTAAEAFVRLTKDDVWRLCRYLGTDGQADDLTQETYARAFAGLHRYAGRASARSWLLGIARHVCADAVTAQQRERRRRGRPDPFGDEREDRTPSPDHAGMVQLKLLLATLDRERREAFVLTQLLGFSYADAAAVCRCPIGTIRSRVARARDDLRAGFGDR